MKQPSRGANVWHAREGVRVSGGGLSLGPIKRPLGVNIDGWLMADAAPEHYRDFVSDRDLANLFNWRLAHTRLPFDAALMETEDGWRTLDTAITRCLCHQLTVVLALRHPDHTALFASSDAWRALAGRWRTVAERYREAGTSFELLDTPQPPPNVDEEVLTDLGAPRLSAAASKRAPAPGAAETRAWTALATRLTQEIREVNPTATIVVQSSGALPDTFTHLRPTRDPHTHYSFHAFLPEALTRRGEGTYPGDVDGERWDRDRLQRAIEPALAFARNYDATLYAGAFGCTRGPRGTRRSAATEFAGVVPDRAPRQSRLTWTRSFLSLCRASGIGWSYWTLRHPHFGLLVEGGVDYDLLGVLQSE